MHQVNLRLMTVGAVAVGALFAVTACASGGGGGSAEESLASTYSCDEPDSSTTTDITIAALPILTTGAIYAAIEEGYFAEHGLNPSIESVSTLPATISAVQGGSTDFAFAGTFSLMQAWQNGVPLQIVAPWAGIEPGYPEKMEAGEPGYETEVAALVTMADSGIDDPGDLDGKTVAVTDSQGHAELTTRAVIDEHGGDSDSVTYTVLSPADGYNALLAGQVDAAYSYVPIVNSAEEDGAQIIAWPNIEILEEGPTSVMVATDQYIQENPETVARFNCAIRMASSNATENPDSVRAALAKALDVAPDTYDTSVVAYFYETVDIDALERFQDLMVDYGYLDAPLDLESFVNPVAR
jgi:NitT/TauT family transport system substrate-binding protein